MQRARQARRKVFGGGRMLATVVLAWCINGVGNPPIPAQTLLPTVGTRLDFTLTRADGASVTTQSSRGKWLVVYFGYTFCPDTCPTTLMEISLALAALGPRADAVQGLFVSVDPGRDTPAVLAEYLKSFDPRIAGLSGTSSQIALAAKSFHVFYERQDNDDGTYSYDHSAFIYLVDPDGKFAEAIGAGADSRQIADALFALMKQ